NVTLCEIQFSEHHTKTVEIWDTHCALTLFGNGETGIISYLTCPLPYYLNMVTKKSGFKEAHLNAEDLVGVKILVADISITNFLRLVGQHQGSFGGRRGQGGMCKVCFQHDFQDDKKFKDYPIRYMSVNIILSIHKIESSSCTIRALGTIFEASPNTLLRVNHPLILGSSRAYNGWGASRTLLIFDTREFETSVKCEP
ncbi:9575_t:CDS:2, partial [Acaulospora morrowiae]